MTPEVDCRKPSLIESPDVSTQPELEAPPSPAVEPPQLLRMSAAARAMAVPVARRAREFNTERNLSVNCFMEHVAVPFLGRET